MFRTRIRCAFLLATPIVFSPVAAMADGGFWPERAFPKMPEIPAQRAIIAFRDGVETLIVESAVASQSANVGWILPLPAEPTSIAPADPGIMRTMWFCTRPEVVHGDHTRRLYVLTAVAGLLVLLGGMAFTPDRWGPVLGRFFRVLAWCALVSLYFAMLLLPSLGSARGLAGAEDVIAPGISVLQAVRAGSYDVTVLRAQSPEALSNWLEGKQLRRLDAQAEGVVRDYIAANWCFAVAALRVEKGKASVPHPLRATFPAGGPIYPMRLTRLAGGTVDLELYTIADRRAAHPLMKVEFADQYARQPLRNGPFKAAYVGEVSDGIALPELCELMWDQCMVTKLTGKLTPEQMGEDLAFTLKDDSTKRPTVYTSKGARETAAMVGLAGAILAALVTILWKKGYKQARRALRLGAVLLMLSLVAAGATYVALPRAQTGAAFRGGLLWGHPIHMRGAARHMATTGWFTPDMSDEAIAARILKSLPEWLSETDNPFLGGPIRREKSPGNFWIQTIGPTRYFIAYGLDGRPFCAELFPAPHADRDQVPHTP